MRHIDIVDETMRDGQQSLWGLKMQAGMALPIAPTLDRAGYSVIDLAGSSVHEVMVRYCQEDPWAGLDLLVQAMPRTPVRGGMRSNACVTMGVSPDALMDIWMRQLNRHGVRSYWIYDCLYNLDKIQRLARLAKQFGSEVVVALGFSISPVHTDEYFANLAGRISTLREVDGLLWYDSAGILDVRRLGQLAPKLKAAVGGKKIEFHANNLLGMSGPAYLEAVELGLADCLHTASRPMANAASVPSTESVLRNLEIRGFTHSIDKRTLPPVAEHFERVGRAAGFPTHQFAEYDLLQLQHQVPGGMMGSLLRQLREHNIADRLQEVLEEIPRVRAECGWVVMATPFSQIIATQAVLNVLEGERYKTITDQMVAFAGQFYGEPTSPFDPDVQDRILSSARAAAVLDNPPTQQSEDELRRHYDTTDDDELILRALVPKADIERMRAAGPIRTDFPLLSSRELQHVVDLVRAATTPYARLVTDTFEVEIAR
jgi:oxaloacetate decarboxylase alpha subunit